MNIVMLDDHVCHLGEGPLWDANAAMLYWVDSLGPTLFCHDHSSGKTRRWTLPGKTVGSLAVREQGGLILAMDQGIYAFDPARGDVQLIAEPLAQADGLRFNDGKVDPFGHFVTGAMNIDYRDPGCNGVMYRLSPQLEVSEILGGFNCFNGPCFSELGDRMYVTGREAGVIEVFDYGRELAPRNGCVLLADCNPDGATVDADGFVWSAQWDDACILRIDEDGRVDDRIDFPGQVVSSVMFGGPNLDLIFVTTTAAEVCGVRPTTLRPGRVLVVSDSGYRGRPEPVFAG